MNFGGTQIHSKIGGNLEVKGFSNQWFLLSQRTSVTGMDRRELEGCKIVGRDVDAELITYDKV